MKIKLTLLASALLATGCVTTTQQSDNKSHWGYTGHEGPEYWGSLHKNNATCDKGLNQSPINLSGFIQSDLVPLKLEYKPGGYEVLNNGHTIQINFQPGSKLDVDGHYYELKQFHFHSPSENHISGKSYPMEVHLVHADINGNLAVVAIMFEEGTENKTLKTIWNTMPKIAGEKINLSSIVSAKRILPDNRDYYRFNGSLTTPPCTEGVLWLVMKQSITASKVQIDQFNQVMHHPTNRPIQPVNARPVLE